MFAVGTANRPNFRSTEIALVFLRNVCIELASPLADALSPRNKDSKSPTRKNMARP